MVNVYVSEITSICINGKGLLRQFTFHQKYRERSQFKADVWHTEKLIVGQSDEIYGVNTNN